MEPVLLVIGAQKSGTTAVFDMLSKHPKAAPPRRKELDFFNRIEEYRKGMSYYRSQFPFIPAKTFGHFTFEASPSYLFRAETCAPRIARDLPKALCVAILRDPVKRAFSAWNMYRDFKGHPVLDRLHDPRSFQQAVEDELAGRTSEMAHRYLARSMYDAQITVFQKNLGKNKLRVISYPDLKKDPFKEIEMICNDLGLPPMPKDMIRGNNRRHVVAYTEQLDEGLAEELYAYFTPMLKRLDQLVGRKLELSGNH
jgi:hypothetical protein